MLLTLEQDVIFRSNLHHSIRNDQGVLAIRRIFSLVDMITNYTNFKTIGAICKFDVCDDVN